MKPQKPFLPFRIHHLFTLLEKYETSSLPIDVLVSYYFREHKALGSKDRLFLADTIYELIRWKKLLEYIAQKKDWPSLYHAWENNDLKKISRDRSFPPDIRLSTPLFLYEAFIKQYGKEKGEELCRINNTQAPTTLRANPLKTSREDLLKQLQDRYPAHPTTRSPYGIVIERRIPFTTLPEFQAGLFEVQDEGSQLLAALIDAKPGDLVLDYCAGSGGKTLAFAPQMHGKGQIYLHDIRQKALEEAKKRLRRAGIENAQILEQDEKKHRLIKKKMDWVLVDAPCSGTGTLRRNPDQKWKMDPTTIERLVGVQRSIFEKALSYCRPGGKIVYATCSLLEEENEHQVAHFCQTYPVHPMALPFQTFPTHNGMDGFFATIFKKNL